jgi:hypothetical protein
MQEGIAVETYIDEGRLHARQHAHHFARIDVADDAAPAGALYIEFQQRAIFQQRRPGLAWRHIDQYFARHAIPACRSRAAVSNSGKPMTPE